MHGAGHGALPLGSASGIHALAAWLLFPAVITSAFDLASARRLPPPQGEGPEGGAKTLSLAQWSQVPIPNS